MWTENSLKKELFKNDDITVSCNFSGHSLRITCSRINKFLTATERENWTKNVKKLDLTTEMQWHVVVAFLNFSGVVWTKNISYVFQSENALFKFLCVQIIAQKVLSAFNELTQCHLYKKRPLYFVLIHREAIKEAVEEKMITGNRGSGAKRPTFHDLNKQRFQTRPPLISQFNKAFINHGLDTSLVHYLSIAVTSVQTYLLMIYRKRALWSQSLIKYCGIREL